MKKLKKRRHRTDVLLLTAGDLFLRLFLLLPYKKTCLCGDECQVVEITPLRANGRGQTVRFATAVKARAYSRTSIERKQVGFWINRYRQTLRMKRTADRKRI